MTDKCCYTTTCGEDKQATHYVPPRECLKEHSWSFDIFSLRVFALGASTMAVPTEVKEMLIKRQAVGDIPSKKVITMDSMKTLVKVVLLLCLLIYLPLFYLKDFNTIIMDKIKIYRETGSNLSDTQVLELVRNYSLNQISNPLRRTFFHFERNEDQYVKYWRRNIG